MSKTKILKLKLIDLVNELNESTNGNLKFNQQAKTRENMSISGANGRLYVSPSSIGYDVSLSGKSVEESLYNSFKELFNQDCTGFKQTNRNTGIITQPFWRIDNFELVKKAALLYSKTQ